MFRPDFRETVDTGLAGIYRGRYRRQSKRFDTDFETLSSEAWSETGPSKIWPARVVAERVVSPFLKIEENRPCEGVSCRFWRALCCWLRPFRAPRTRTRPTR